MSTVGTAVSKAAIFVSAGVDGVNEWPKPKDNRPNSMPRSLHAAAVASGRKALALEEQSKVCCTQGSLYIRKKRHSVTF